MDSEHSKLFTWYYKNQLLYLQFIVQQKFFKSAIDFSETYELCKTPEHPMNSFNREWRDRMQKELLRFNGKAVIGPDGNEIISDITSDVRSSQKNVAGKPKSAMKNQQSTS